MFQMLTEAINGLRCDAVDPDGNATCWVRVTPDQPGQICDDCWRLLATKGEVSQRVLLAEEPDLPGWVANILAGDPQTLVRAGLAARDDLAGEARTVLFQPDEAGTVTRRLARRDDTSFEEQRILLNCTDVATLRILAGTTMLTDIRRLLARHPDDGVRAAAGAAGC